MLENNAQIIITIAGAIFLLGFVCLVISIIILARQAMNKNIRTIAESTAKLAQKGITDGVSGLVGNASMLLSSLNDLTQSNSGIGIFFVFLSLVLLAVAYFLIKPILFIAS